ncbi:10908_t:CDS:2 [Paraglomus brasilianum]|uniref:tRNA (guanine(9)-N1)-methyltransferase n=1 Tax=Paraglomus brasilianum TaxID=144538 RepID=A0A9N9AUK5_9GLOM|nr:10908_t:CDS:2 [Paraglomus brasilianum]
MATVELVEQDKRVLAPETEESSFEILTQYVSDDASSSKSTRCRLGNHEKRRMDREQYKALLKEKDQKRKEERRRRREAGILPPRTKPVKINKYPSPMSLVIDLSFDELMTDKEITDLSNQMNRSYGANRSSWRPVRLYFTSFGGRIKERFMSKVKDWERWKDVTFTEKSFEEVFVDTSKITYLTADADDVLTDLSEDEVYVIGGLVDRNRHKGVCLRKAHDLGIAAAKLPISSYITMKTRSVLTVNHVAEIMISYVNRQNWEKAFNDIIPKRKFHLSITQIGVYATATTFG